MTQVKNRTKETKKRVKLKPQHGEHVPTELLRFTVAALIAQGSTQEGVCYTLKNKFNTPLCVETLNKYYTDEIKNGFQYFYSHVVGKLAEKIEQGERWAIEFYLSRKGGWKESVSLELENPFPSNERFGIVDQTGLIIEAAVERVEDSTLVG